MDLDHDPTDGLPSRVALARELLRYKMEEYSQDGFCASWLVDLEIELWEAADRQAATGHEACTVATSKACRQLAQIAGGWWVWPDTPRAAGPVFISLAEWNQKLAKRTEAEHI
jgi:hypothetical protein